MKTEDEPTGLPFRIVREYDKNLRVFDEYCHQQWLWAVFVYGFPPFPYECIVCRRAIAGNDPARLGTNPHHSECNAKPPVS